jgi:hypothetical protein
MMAWFEKVKTCVGWDLADQARIAELQRCLDSDLTEMIEALAKQLSRFKGTQPLMANARFVQRLHGVLREWLTGLLGGTFDWEHAEGRSTLGRKLVEIDLTSLGGHPQVLSSTMCTLDKALNLDLALIYSTYREVHDAQMERTLLDRFLAITGFSRTLYENLAEARVWSEEGQWQTEPP